MDWLSIGSIALPAHHKIWNHSPAKQLAGKAISSFAVQMNRHY